MKLMIKLTESGPTRSLNRVIVGLLVVILLGVFAYCTAEGIDAEAVHNDLVVKNFLNRK